MFESVVIDAVGEDVHRAFVIAQHDGAEVDCLDQPAGAVDPGDVADADVVVEDQEEAGDEVLDQRLRAEADGQADDAGAGQHRHDVDVQLAQDGQSRRRRGRATSARSCTSRPSVRARLTCSTRSGPPPLSTCASSRAVDAATIAYQQVGEQRDHQDAQPRGHEPVEERGPARLHRHAERRRRRGPEAVSAASTTRKTTAARDPHRRSPLTGLVASRLAGREAGQRPLRQARRQLGRRIGCERGGT